MNASTDVQIIHQDGVPAFAVVPYGIWRAFIEQNTDENGYIPHEVLGLQLKQDISLIAVWRRHLDLISWLEL